MRLMSVIQKTKIRKIMEVGCRIASLFNPYIPKKNNRILFFESTEDFMNNYALYNYMIAQRYNEKYKLYYFPDISKTASIKKIPLNVVFSNSIFKAFTLFLTTKVIVLDTGNMRMIPSEKQSVVYLDHGLPFKCAGAMSKHPDKTVPLDLIMPVNYFTSPSFNFDSMYIKTYLLKPESILRCGRPRTDAFFEKKNHLSEIGINLFAYNKIIMWMTTYRISKDFRLMHTNNSAWSETNLPILVGESELEEMNAQLAKLNYYLVIKIHASSLFEEKSFKEYTHIKLLQDKDFVSKGLQIYDILKDFDALITDYSSVFWDYLLVDNPIIFITSDIEEYKKANGFYFDEPMDCMPGTKANDLLELIDAVERLDENKKEYREQRKALRDFAHQFQDGCDCKRILDLLDVKL